VRNYYFSHTEDEVIDLNLFDKFYCEIGEQDGLTVTYSIIGTDLGDSIFCKVDTFHCPPSESNGSSSAEEIFKRWCYRYLQCSIGPEDES